MSKKVPKLDTTVVKLRKEFDNKFQIIDDMDWERDLQTEVFVWFVKKLNKFRKPNL